MWDNENKNRGKSRVFLQFLYTPPIESFAKNHNERVEVE